MFSQLYLNRVLPAKMYLMYAKILKRFSIKMDVTQEFQYIVHSKYFAIDIRETLVSNLGDSSMHL